jgi:protein O-mannosyl-transferase
MAKNKPKQNTNTGAAAARGPLPNPKQQPAKTKSNAADTSFFDKYGNFVIPAIIGVLTFLFLKACLNNELTNWDDLGYIITNPLIKDTSPDAIKNIFSTEHPVMGNYHPFTILLYYFEYGKYGLEPWIYHFDSVLLHVLVTIAVYYFVRVLTHRTIAAMIVALLFGLHPMHVESVAWAAGRKDVLYGLFFILSMTCYIYYIRAAGSKKTLWYISVLLLFAISLLAKSVAVTFPVTLFAIDYLEKRKITIWLLIEKIPHFGLSLLFGILSIKAQKDVGALGTLDAHFTALERFALGCYALVTYLWKAIIPVGLTNFYPYPLKLGDALAASYYVYPVIIIALAFAVWRFARHNRVIIFGLAFFIINILLLLQFIPVGGAIFSDRYGYIPYLGLFFILGWFVSEYFEVPAKVATGKILLGATLVYCLILGFMSSERCKDWYDSVSLWKDNIEKHPEAPVGYFYLGQEYFTRYEKATSAAQKKAMGDSALMMFNMSVQRKPDYINPIICVAELQRNYGQIDDAKQTYYKALKINPKNESVYLGLAVIYSIKQQFDSAAYCFRTGLSLKPFAPEGHSNFANFYDITGKVDSSLKEYAIAIAQNPDAYIPYMNRGRIYMRQNKLDDALRDFNKSISLNPDSGESLYLRGKTYLLKGDKVKAAQDIKDAQAKGYTQIDPNIIQQLK